MLKEILFLYLKIYMKKMIGLSLGDLNIHKQYTNAKLRFELGLIYEAYALYLYDLFKDYCSSGLNIVNRFSKKYAINKKVSYNYKKIYPEPRWAPAAWAQV